MLYFQAGGSGIKLLEREVAILKKVSHPNIIQLNEVFETAKVNSLYYFQEFCFIIHPQSVSFCELQAQTMGFFNFLLQFST